MYKYMSGHSRALLVTCNPLHDRVVGDYSGEPRIKEGDFRSPCTVKNKMSKGKSAHEQSTVIHLSVHQYVCRHVLVFSSAVGPLRVGNLSAISTISF